MDPTPESGRSLPEPDPAGAAHSNAVAQHVRDRIAAAGGSISFAEFMHEVLYAPSLGYYSAGASKLGAAGDFVTAPEISPLFGRIVACQAASVLEQLDGGDILEPGAGSGALAISVLTKLAELDQLPERYLILEVSADLKERQEARLRREIPQFMERVSWISQLPEKFCGVVIANEVADAIPVERFRIDGGNVMQARIGIADDSIAWCFSAAPDYLEAAVREIEADIGHQLADGYESEVSPALAGWIGDLSSSMELGLILLIDYGVTRSEYYAPDRHSGWLRCHFRHHAHNDPLILPGIQDLTAWVDFSLVAAAANNMKVAGYITQAHFLMNGGLEAELSDFPSLPLKQQIELSGQVKLLTLPAEMGENFKCIGLVCGDINVPPAFETTDRAHLL
jgi:SAM-dependent MidA family methyltransferase